MVYQGGNLSKLFAICIYHPELEHGSIVAEAEANIEMIIPQQTETCWQERMMKPELCVLCTEMIIC